MMQEKSAIEDFCALLKKNGLKATSQRLAVHQAMMELGHASADMVCDFLAEKPSTHVTVASVYNILSQLAELGIYSYCHSCDNKKYFDVTPDSRIHLYDRVNHSFKDIADDKLYEKIMASIGRRHFKGYKIEKVEIQFVVHPTKPKRVD